MKLLLHVLVIAGLSLIFLKADLIDYGKNSTSFLADQATLPVEKIYVHTDRPSYFIGDQLWFKAYLLNGESHRPETRSKMVYVELIDPYNEIIGTREILTEAGGGDGEFLLSMSLKPGLYTLRAYTNYMRNFDESFFFTKEFTINSFNENGTTKSMAEGKTQDSSNKLLLEKEKPDVQFFPEGGYMVNGLPCRLGFKAIDQFGNGVDIEGVIVDREGSEILNFQSMHLGMGSLIFVPDSSQGIRAKIYFRGQAYFYDLPGILEQGLIMRLVSRGDFFQINLESSQKKGLDRLQLLGLQRGSVVLEAQIKGGKTNATIKIPKKDLKHGIVKFTILDKNNKAICERLSFVEKNETKPMVKLSTSKKEYLNRELVQVNLELNGVENKSAEVSVSVSDMAFQDQTDCGLDIESYLLIDSEIKGKIEDPCYYLNSNDPQRSRMLDLLLITQGWRNYLWQEVSDKQANQLDYSFETGKDFKGSVRSRFNHEVRVQTDVSLTYTNRKIMGHNEGKTFGNGQFLFPGYLFTDSTSIIIQAKKEKLDKKGASKKELDMNRDFFIQMDSTNPPVISFHPSYLKPEPEKASQISYETDAYLDSAYANQTEVVELKDVELKVTSRYKVDPNRRGNMRYAAPSKRVDYKEQNITALGDDLFWGLENWVPGLQKRGGGFYYRGSKVDFFLDGVRFSNANSLNTLINANDVSFIDVLSGPQAASYGSQAAIVVYSKTPEERMRSNNLEPRKGIVNFIYPGLYQAKKFYKPKYLSNDQNKDKLDYRITLHWEPKLVIDSKKPAQISFYTADPSSTYKIQMEGITSNGQAVKSEAFFRVGE